MFLTNSCRRYTRDGQQRAAGRFLILFSHNQYKWEEQNNVAHTDLTGQTFDVLNGDGFTVQRVCQCGGTGPCAYKAGETAPSDYLKYCPVHKAEYRTMPATFNRALYAHVCHVSMSQCGQFMMGTSRTLQVNKAYGKESPPPNNLILSGTYGSDGLTCDYEDLTESSRKKLVQVPADLTEVFWAGGGHNSAGSEAPAMHDWALRTFKVKGGNR